MEIVSFEPLILLDGAHNTAGMTRLRESIEEELVVDRVILVIGILSDKNLKGILDVITPLADIVVATKSHNKRACDPSILKDMIQDKDEIIIGETSSWIQ